MWTLDPRCEISLHAPDVPGDERTEELGCGLQGPQSRAVREAGRLLRARLLGMDRARALRQAGALVDWLEARPEWKRISTARGTAGGRRRLAQRVLYPPCAPVPSPLLHVRQGTRGFDYAVPEGAWPAVADLFAGLSRGLAEVAPKHPVAAELHAELRAAGWLVPEPARRPDVARPGLCFVGHNTVRVATRRAAVLFDPWFRPWHDADPPGYRPLLPRDMGRLDAIFITHAHGDHFHLGSLVHFPRDTPVFVPRVRRDTLLAHDLRPFLRAAGFTRARALGWGDEVRVGDLAVQALPFYGEQPTAGAVCYPDVRNAGNTYAARGPGVSAAFLADSGRDALGDMRDVGLGLAARPVEWLFTGCRAFSLYPLFYPLTTLDAFFMNVPRDLMAVRQKLMNDVDDALDVAESFGAKFCVPYADGGAPWYWREGTGPAYAGYPEYPGWRRAPEGPSDDPAADPFPERLAQRAHERASPVAARILRPGDSVRGGRVVRFAGARWPYGGSS